MKDLYIKAINKVKLAFFKEGAPDSPTYIKKIGYEWQHFGAIEGDSAIRVSTGDPSIYAIMYKFPAGATFPPHFHLVKETGILLKGKLEIITPDKSWIVEESGSFEINAYVWHKVRMINEGIIFLQFYPAFENGEWVGFKEGEDETK
jgi:quercetin dioxygenase-like cupin family protein